jgi:hypothetical protein
VYYPDIDNLGLDTQTNGVVALSQYDRAFLLSVVNVSRFWGTLTNEQQGYIEQLENVLMADDITVLLQEIRDAIALGGGGSVAPAPVVSFNPVVSLVNGGCGCPEDVGLLRLNPCTLAKGTGGKWDGEWYKLPLREDGQLSIEGELDAGEYGVTVAYSPRGENRDFSVVLEYGGGGVSVDYFIADLFPSDTWAHTFTLKARGDVSLVVAQLAENTDAGLCYVKASLCKIKRPLGGRQEVQLDVKPKPNSLTGQAGGFPTLGGGSSYVATPKDSEFTTTNTFTDSQVVISSRVVIFFEFFPDLPELIKTALRGLIALAFPPLALIAFADEVELELFGVSVLPDTGTFTPEGDGFLLELDFELPVEGIPALVTDPLGFIDFANFSMSVVTTSENETLAELLLTFTGRMFVRWAKLVIDTGAITP